MRFIFIACLVVWLAIATTTVQSSDDSELARGMKILTPVKDSLVLAVNDLKRLLEADDIKDRFLVVISVSGAVRQRKTFLLEFLVQYLNAQVIEDWNQNRDFEIRMIFFSSKTV